MHAPLFRHRLDFLLRKPERPRLHHPNAESVWYSRCKFGGHFLTKRSAKFPSLVYTIYHSACSPVYPVVVDHHQSDPIPEWLFPVSLLSLGSLSHPSKMDQIHLHVFRPIGYLHKHHIANLRHRNATGPYFYGQTCPML